MVIKIVAIYIIGALITNFVLHIWDLVDDEVLEVYCAILFPITLFVFFIKLPSIIYDYIVDKY